MAKSSAVTSDEPLLTVKARTKKPVDDGMALVLRRSLKVGVRRHGEVPTGS